ncbi:2'-5' RNA ligase family protein [Marilutibacter chinensis]|uniref:2'-5' RNA ligase family protein n=1 Tax=Marilutibacter chinensis TaxID=2912247 RepID=A0ABS9HQJ6_9GAMM|nr:2'-5' RNA ligase family protein [Lysobacter chinensis]
MSRQAQLAGFEVADATPRYSLFFALLPDDAIRARVDAAATAVEAGQPHGGRRLRPHRYHLTLRWLGTLPENCERELEVARGAAESACTAGIGAFKLPLDIAGGFASARVCWLGCHTVPTALHELRAALDDGLVRRGAAAGVRFGKGPALVPHVTVARDCRQVWTETAIDAPVPWHVDGFALVRSDIQRHHAHAVVGRWVLPD